MSSLHHPVAILAADTIQQVSITIIFVISVCLMLVPFAACVVLVFVEVRAHRRDLRTRAEARHEPGMIHRGPAASSRLSGSPNGASLATPPMVPRPSQVAPRGETT